MGLPERSQFLQPLLQACRDADIPAATSHLVHFTEAGPDIGSAVQEVFEALSGKSGKSGKMHTQVSLALQAMGPDALPFVTEMLNLRQTHLRASAVGILFGIDSPEATDGLIGALDDRKASIYLQVAHEFGYGKRVETMSPDLISRLNRKFIRFLDGDYEQLRINFSSEIDNIQHCIIYYFGRLGATARDAVPSLIRLLQDNTSHVDVRRCAALALGPIGAPEAVPALLNALSENTEDPSWRRFVTNSLSRIGQSGNVQASLLTAESKPNELDIEAARYMPQLKSFYLLGRLYKEGKTSVRSVADSLKSLEAKLFAEELPVSHVSFSGNTEKLAELFRKVLKKEQVVLFIKTPGFGNKLSDDAWQAWEWTDAFLRKYQKPDWFGFSRLSPEEEPDTTS